MGSTPPAASAVAPPILPECSANSSGNISAIVPFSFHFSATFSRPELRYWVACPLVYTLHSFLNIYTISGTLDSTLVSGSTSPIMPLFRSAPGPLS